MKIAIYIILALSIALLAFNLTNINYEAPFEGNSLIAAICVMACACAAVLLIILLISRKIAEKNKRV